MQKQWNCQGFENWSIPAVKQIFKALVSSASLILHTSTQEEEFEKLLTTTGTDLLNGMEMLYPPVINTAG